MRFRSPPISIKIDPHCHRRRCSPMSVVSGNIRFMRVFVGVLWRWGVKRQWGNRRSIFSAFRRCVFGTLRNEANVIIKYYLFPLVFSLTSKYVTVNGHFKLNFRYYEQRFQKYFYIHDQQKQTVIRRIFWNPRKDCGMRIFRRRNVAGATIIVGILTNKTVFITQYYYT